MMATVEVVKCLKEGYKTIKEFPFILIPALLRASLGLLPTFNSTGEQVKLGLLLLSFSMGVVLLLIRVYVNGWILKMAYDHKEETPDLKKGASYTFGRYLPLLGASILYYLVTGLGFIALIIPGVYLATRLSVFKQSVMINDKGVIESLKESWGLVKDNWWEMFFLGVATIVPSVALPLALVPLYSLVPNFILTGLNVIFDTFILPWRVSSITSAYLQLKD